MLVCELMWQSCAARLHQQCVHARHRTHRRPHHGSVRRRLPLHVDQHHRHRARRHVRRQLPRRRRRRPAGVAAHARRHLHRRQRRLPVDPRHHRSRHRSDIPAVAAAADRRLHDGHLPVTQPGARHGVAARRQAGARRSAAHRQHRRHDLRLLHRGIDRRHVSHRLLADLLARHAQHCLDRRGRAAYYWTGGRRVSPIARSRPAGGRTARARARVR